MGLFCKVSAVLIMLFVGFCFVFLTGCPPKIDEPPYPKSETGPPVQPVAGEKGPVFQHTFSKVGKDAFPSLGVRGDILFYSSTNITPYYQIFSKTLSGQTVTQVSQSTADDIFPRQSPDGSKIAFVSNRSGKFDIYIVNYPVGTEQPRLLMPGVKTEKIYPSWSNDGKRIVFSQRNPSSGMWELAIFDLTDNSISYPREGINALFPEWCPVAGSETIVFQRASGKGRGVFSIWLVDSDGSNLIRLFESPDYGCVTPTWSPDGSKIAYATVAKSPTAWGKWSSGDNIWVIDRDGSNNRQVTFHSSEDWAPAFSRDGSRIVFLSNRGGNQNVWSIPID